MMTTAIANEGVTRNKHDVEGFHNYRRWQALQHRSLGRKYTRSVQLD
jgi:hypothetical protein